MPTRPLASPYSAGTLATRMPAVAIVCVRFVDASPSTVALLTSVTTCAPAPVLRMRSSVPAGTVSTLTPAPLSSVTAAPAESTWAAGLSAIGPLPELRKRSYLKCSGAAVVPEWQGPSARRSRVPLREAGAALALKVLERARRHLVPADSHLRHGVLELRDVLEVGQVSVGGQAAELGEQVPDDLLPAVHEILGD